MTVIPRLSASASTTARTTRLAGANATAGVTFMIIRSPAPEGHVAATIRIPTRQRPIFIVHHLRRQSPRHDGAVPDAVPTSARRGPHEVLWQSRRFIA